MITLGENHPQGSILLVEDDPGLSNQMQWSLSPRKVLACGSRAEAVQTFQSAQNCHVVVLDLGLPPDPDGASEGLALLTELLNIAPRAKIIVVSGNSERRNASKAAGLGVFDYIPKPADVD